MIQSFGNKETTALFNRKFVKRFSAIERQARRKLEIIEAATSLDDLRSPDYH